MLCVKDGKVCWMIYDENKKEWVYIPEKEFFKQGGAK